MKMVDKLLDNETEQEKAERKAKLVKNSCEREIMELEHDIFDKEQRLEEMYNENMSIVSLVELEQEIDVLKDTLKRAKNKMEELF